MNILLSFTTNKVVPSLVTPIGLNAFEIHSRGTNLFINDRPRFVTVLYSFHFQTCAFYTSIHLDIMSVDATSLKLPALWINNPEAWFLHVESQFAIRKITADDTKYHYVVAALDSDSANRALSVLQNPPTDGKFDKFKKFLLSAYGKTHSERATALFNLNGLGDYKPSELMDKMLALLGAHEPCFLFRHLFLQQLPDFVRIPLANSVETDCRKLALEADNLYLSGKQHQAQVQAVRSPHTVSKPTKTQTRCWYHTKFGARAKKCEQPCCFSVSLDSGNGLEGQQ